MTSGLAFQHMLDSKADSVTSSGLPRTEREKIVIAMVCGASGARIHQRLSQVRIIQKTGDKNVRDSKVDPQFGTELGGSFFWAIASRVNAGRGRRDIGTRKAANQL